MVNLIEKLKKSQFADELNISCEQFLERGKKKEFLFNIYNKYIEKHAQMLRLN